MSADDLSTKEKRDLGIRVKAETDNRLIQSFAAEMIGESYPLSKAMADIVFENRNEVELGYKFAKWMDEGE